MVALAGLVVAATAACSGSSAATGSPTRSSTTTSTAAATGDPTGVEATDRTVRTPDGRTRTYRVVTPRSVPRNRALPLLIALHGGVGSGAQFERTSGFDDLAVRDHFVVVYPDGIEIGGASALAHGRVWNGGRCCGAAAREQVDDVGFIRTVIDRVERSRAIDRSRVYGTGHSNGAIMSYRLACELSDRIVAIGLQAGTIEIPSCAPAHPVSVLAIHGTADTNIPIEGGRGTGVAGIVFSSPMAAVDAFARIDRCGPPGTATRPDNPDVSFETWTGCADGTGVELVRVAGANHAWMGHPSPRASTALTAAPYQGFDSSVAIWDFLSRHSRAT
jgi:polyhydroxybutyrate depolymerase